MKEGIFPKQSNDLLDRDNARLQDQLYSLVKLLNSETEIKMPENIKNELRVLLIKSDTHENTLITNTVENIEELINRG